MTEPAGRSGLGALAHRNFRLFLIGQGISLIGTWMQNIGEGWLVLTLTNSPFYVGLVSPLSSLGVLLPTTYPGIVADPPHNRPTTATAHLLFTHQPLPLPPPV